MELNRLADEVEIGQEEPRCDMGRCEEDCRGDIRCRQAWIEVLYFFLGFVYGIIMGVFIGKWLPVRTST